jgi:hypothetical protein
MTGAVVTVSGLCKDFPVGGGPLGGGGRGGF